MADAARSDPTFDAVGKRNGERPFFYDIEDLPILSTADREAMQPGIDMEEFYELVGRNLRSQVILLSPTLTMGRMRVGPGEHVKPHRHGTNQITFVLAGALHYGNRVVSAGMGFFSPDTKYTWTSGPDGADWLEIHDGPPQLLVKEET